MEALELFKIRERMCKQGCKKCPVSYTNNGFQLDCLIFMLNQPEKFVRIAEDWAVKHPIKSRGSVLKEVFPNVEEDRGVPTLCPAVIDCKRYHEINCVGRSCSDCKKNYWEGEYVK